MTHTEPGVDASGAPYDGEDALTRDWEDIKVEANPETAEPTPFETVQATLFHPGLDSQVKVVLLQLIWLGKEVTADDLTKGTGLTNLSVQHSLRKGDAYGLVQSRFILPDAQSPMTEKVYRTTDAYLMNLGKLSGGEDTPEN